MTTGKSQLHHYIIIIYRDSYRLVELPGQGLPAVAEHGHAEVVVGGWAGVH